MSEADKDGRIAQMVADRLQCLGMEIQESLRVAIEVLDQAIAELEADGWSWPPDTCETHHCICRRHHQGGHVIADTRSTGEPW